jgi:hypothetical protein
VRNGPLEAFADPVRGNLDNVQLWLDRVAQDNPAKALVLMLQLSRYVLPELKAMALEVQPPAPDLRRLSMTELQRIVAEADDSHRSRAKSAVCADLIGDITN